MRLENLVGRSSREQKRLITNNQKVFLRNALKHPKKFKGKIIVYLGNCTGFYTRNFMVRTFEYVEDKKKWQVADVDLTNVLKIEKPEYYTKKNIQKKFKAFCNAQGFILKK